MMKRIEARDRRSAAVHEAGHLVIAEHLGVPHIGAGIWRTTTSGQIALPASAIRLGGSPAPTYTQRDQQHGESLR